MNADPTHQAATDDVAPRLPLTPLPPGTRRVVRARPFGRFTRYQTGQYLQHVAIVAFGLLLVALTIDLSQWLPRLVTDPRAGDNLPSTLVFVARYLALRAPDILLRLLPIGCFLGVMWAELATLAARHRVAFQVTGRAPLQSLMPALLVGLAAGVVQMSLETVIRPTVVAIQAAERIGEFGDRFDRGRATGPVWMFAGRDALRARLVRQPALELRDLLVLRFDSANRITEVISADRARPLASGVWELTAGLSLPMAGMLPSGKSDHFGALPPGGAATGVAIGRVPLDLDLGWLAERGVAAKYLAQRDLVRLAAGDGSAYPVGEYRTWLQTRYAALVLPLAMALLAASLCLVLLSGRIRLERALAIGLAGYGCHIALRAFSSLGERAIVAPVVAAWIVPVAAILAAALLLLADARRNAPA